MFTIATGCLLLIGGAGGVFLACFNHLRTLESRCAQATTDIDAQFQVRHDLVQTIVPLIADADPSVADGVLQARDEAISAEHGCAQFRAELSLGTKLQKLMISAERFPNLTAHPDFARLQSELCDLEARIVASRRVLNLATNEHNMAIKQFPYSLIARRSGKTCGAFYGLSQGRTFAGAAATA